MTLPDFGNIDAIGQWAGVHGPVALGVSALLCALGVPVPVPILLAGPWLRDHMHGKWQLAWTKAESLFQRYSGMAVALSRSVLGAIGLPVDWIAGSSGFSYWRFALSATVGDGVWIVASAAVGYWLGENWQRYAEVLPVAIAVIVVAVALIYLAGRFMVKRLGNGEQPGEPMVTPEPR